MMIVVLFVHIEVSLFDPNSREPVPGVVPKTFTIKVRYSHAYVRTVNVERFAGLNFRGFHPINISWENFCGAIHLKYLNNTIMRRLYI